MPDVLLFAKATCAAAAASMMTVLALAVARRSAGDVWQTTACLLALAAGLFTGVCVLPLPIAVPPGSGLDRLLVIALPAAWTILWFGSYTSGREWRAGLFWKSQAADPTGCESPALERITQSWSCFRWCVRFAFCAALPRVLLHGSVYLNGTDDEWSSMQITVAMVTSSFALACLWVLLDRLAMRPAGASVPVAIALAVQCAAVTIMLAGYLKGGAFALLLCASLLATTLSVTAWAKFAGFATAVQSQVLTAIGLIGLFSVVLIGRFFGRLTTESAIIMLFSPLLCWLTEWRMLRLSGTWRVVTGRLVLVSIPLAILLVLAKQKFDQELGALL